MRRTRKLLGALLALVICLGMLPTVAMATEVDTTEIYLGTAQIEADTYYIVDNNYTVSSEGASGGNYNIHLSADGEILTLNNLDFAGATVVTDVTFCSGPEPSRSFSNTALYVSGDITLVLLGQNTLVNKGADNSGELIGSSIGYTMGLYVEGS